MKKPILEVVIYYLHTDLFGQPIYVYHNVYINKHNYNKNKTHEYKNSNK